MPDMLVSLPNSIAKRKSAVLRDMVTRERQSERQGDRNLEPAYGELTVLQVLRIMSRTNYSENLEYSRTSERLE